MEQADAHVAAFINKRLADALAPSQSVDYRLIGEIMARSFFPMAARPGFSGRWTLRRRLLGGFVSRIVDTATWELSLLGNEIAKIGHAMISLGTKLLIRWERWLSDLPAKGEN